MLSKNNRLEQFHKQQPKKQRFTIKKLTVGVASVLIGFTFMGFNASASADDIQTQSSSDNNVQPETTTVQSNLNVTLSSTVAQSNYESQTNAASVKSTNTDVTSNVAARTESAVQTSASAAVKSNTLATASSASALSSAAKDATSAAETTNLNLNNLNSYVNTEMLLTNLATTHTSTTKNTADVANFADLSKAIVNKDITTINITQDIDLTNMTTSERAG